MICFECPHVHYFCHNVQASSIDARHGPVLLYKAWSKWQGHFDNILMQNRCAKWILICLNLTETESSLAMLLPLQIN